MNGHIQVFSCKIYYLKLNYRRYQEPLLDCMYLRRIKYANYTTRLSRTRVFRRQTKAILGEGAIKIFSSNSSSTYMIVLKIEMTTYPTIASRSRKRHPKKKVSQKHQCLYGSACILILGMTENQVHEK